MKQIKTIMNPNPDKFDKEVNAALADGWYIVRRLANHDGFIAELEKVVITKKERSCDNCKYSDMLSTMEPCDTCRDLPEGYPSKWEPIE